MFGDAFSSSDSDSEDIPTQQVDNRFIQQQFPEDDDKEEKRIVKSAKDKRFEEMQMINKNMQNHKKIKDIPSVFNDFEALVKVYEKSAKLNEMEVVPLFFVKSIADLEDFITDSWEKKKAFNKTAAKALSTLRQRVKKFNRQFDDNIQDMRENPEKYQEEAVVNESESVSGDDEPASAAEDSSEKSDASSDDGGGAGGAGGQRDDDDESDSDSWAYSDDSSSGSDIEMQLDKFKGDPAAFFLKDELTDGVKKEKSKFKKPVKEQRAAAKKAKLVQEEQIDGDDADQVGEPRIRAFEKGQEITFQVVLTKLKEILISRGKKGTSISEQITLLLQVEDKIVEHKLSAALHTRVLFALISVLFDYDKKRTNCMSPSLFDKALNVTSRLLTVLEENEIELMPLESNADEVESLETAPFRVCGSLISVITMFDTECTKMLQNANGHELEYIDRLRDERRVCALLDRLSTFLEKKEAPAGDVCRVYLLRVEHMYYKFDFPWARRVESEGIEVVGPNDSTAVIHQLCQYIYKHDQTARLRTRAILCEIFHLALYDDWFKARDLMLMSNLQLSIDHADQSTMILYNRTLVQLGLSAFRQGHIREAHNALADLMQSGRVRELLAQGAPARYDRTADDERRDLEHQTPYHMFLNTELLECIYFVAAMLLEIPNLAAHETDLKWRPISKPFHLALRDHDRATLIGPPETPRYHVLAAAKAMRYGNWKSCYDFIFNPKMDAKIWDLFFQSARVKRLLEVRIKEESLRSFLFTYSAIHDSLSLDKLAEYFDMPKNSVYSIICKMIVNQELAASLEVPSDFLIMHKTERSRLQTLALQLSEKINSIVDMNEKFIEQRPGTAGAGQTGGNKGRRQGQRYGARFN